MVWVYLLYNRFILLHLFYFVLYVLIELQKANSIYQEKLTAGHTADQTMFNLSWDVEELKSIHEDCQKLYTELSCCINFCTDELFHSQNAPNKLTKIRSKLCEVVK